MYTKSVVEVNKVSEEANEYVAGWDLTDATLVKSELVPSAGK